MKLGLVDQFGFVKGTASAVPQKLPWRRKGFSPGGTRQTDPLMKIATFPNA
jgi:hypothetical protein